MLLLYIRMLATKHSLLLCSITLTVRLYQFIAIVLVLSFWLCMA